METILNTNKYEAASVDFAELLFGFSDFYTFLKTKPNSNGFFYAIVTTKIFCVYCFIKKSKIRT